MTPLRAAEPTAARAPGRRRSRRGRRRHASRRIGAPRPGSPSAHREHSRSCAPRRAPPTGVTGQQHGPFAPLGPERPELLRGRRAPARRRRRVRPVVRAARGPRHLRGAHAPPPRPSSGRLRADRLRLPSAAARLAPAPRAPSGVVRPEARPRPAETLVEGSERTVKVFRGVGPVTAVAVAIATAGVAAPATQAASTPSHALLAEGVGMRAAPSVRVQQLQRAPAQPRL